MLLPLAGWVYHAARRANGILDYVEKPLSPAGPKCAPAVFVEHCAKNLKSPSAEPTGGPTRGDLTDTIGVFAPVCVGLASKDPMLVYN